jgi:glutamine synthetase type III
MFWSKTTVQSDEFQILFKKFENLRTEVEGIKIDLALYRNKLFRKAGIVTKEEEDKPKEPSVLLTPSGTYPK